MPLASLNDCRSCGSPGRAARTRSAATAGQHEDDGLDHLAACATGPGRRRKQDDAHHGDERRRCAMNIWSELLSRADMRGVPPLTERACRRRGRPTAGARGPDVRAGDGRPPARAGTCGWISSARSSRCCRGSSSVLLPVIQAVISFQKEPAPTAPGIRSEPSKRNTASGSCRISTDSLSIGLARLATSRPVVGADPAAVRRGLGLLVGPRVGGQVGLERLHLGTVGERRHELAAAEDRLAVVLVDGRAGRTRRRRRPRRPRCPRASWRRRSSPGGAARTCRRGSAGRRPGRSVVAMRLDVADAAVDVLRRSSGSRRPGRAPSTTCGSLNGISWLTHWS